MNRVVFFLLFLSLPLVILSQERSVVDSLNLKFQTAESDSVKIDLLFKLSKVYQTNDFQRSLEYAQSALKVARKSKLRFWEAKANNKIGILLYRIGQYDGSLDYFLRSKKIYEELGEKSIIIGQIHNICGIYIQLQEYAKAQELYAYVFDQQKELLKQGDSTNMPQMHSFYNSMGIICDKKGEDSLARGYFLDALENAQKYNYNARLGGIYNNLGENAWKLGEKEDALRYLNLSIENSKKVNDKFELSRAYLLLCQNSFNQKDYSKAIDIAKRALAVSTEIGALEPMEKAAFLLYSIYKKTGDSRNALEAHEKYLNYHDSLFNEQSVKNITRLQMLYEFDKKEKIRKQEQFQLKLKFGVIVLILTFGMITTGLLYRLHKSRARSTYFEKKSLEKDLELKEKELAMKVIHLLERNETMNEVVVRLSELKPRLDDANKDFVHKVIKEVESNMNASIWEEFEIRFQQVHEGFYKNLREQFPDLSHAEERLAALLRLGMSTKEIAAITHQSVKGIEVARTRLRKKLNLTNTEINLVEFLAGL